MKYRKLLISLILLSCLTGLLVFLLQPCPLINRSLPFYFSHLIYNGEDMTKETDEKALYEILSKYSRKKISTGKNTYSPEHLKMEISYIEDHTPIQLLLGEDMYYYGDGERYLYTIQDGEELLRELEALYR